MRTRFALLFLAALLVLPMAQSDSPVEAKKRSRAVTRTFSNPSEIRLPEVEVNLPIPSSLYPSAIEVSELKGKIRDVNLRLNGLTHAYPDQVHVLLVGPDGQTAIVMANVGSFRDASAVSLRLDDEAADPLPDEGGELQSGAFRPTYVMDPPGEHIVFVAPAPSAGQNAALSVFDGGNPNGTWRLFVQDRLGSLNTGTFAGGWEMEITAQAKAKKSKR